MCLNLPDGSLSRSGRVIQELWSCEAGGYKEEGHSGQGEQGATVQVPK